MRTAVSTLSRQGVVVAAAAGRAARRLVYAGKGRHRITRGTAREIHQRLDPIVRPDEPRFEADVEYLEVSEDGRLRHPSFRGLAPRATRRKGKA